MARSRRKTNNPQDAAEQNFLKGYYTVKYHPMFAPLMTRAHVYRDTFAWEMSVPAATDGWAVVTSNGSVYANPKRKAEPEQWVYVIAHCLLHLSLGHFQEKHRPVEWNTACDCFTAKFLKDLKLGRAPSDINSDPGFPGNTEDKIYKAFCDNGIPPEALQCGTGSSQQQDMLFRESSYSSRNTDWTVLFGIGLSDAITSAINVAAGVDESLGVSNQAMTPARRALNWIISSYPLLGAMAANFQIVEDPKLCIQLGISIAAVDAQSKEVFINPAAGLDDHEARFVVAHELLHVGLRHDARQRGRDAFLWNVACDYVINGWLVEMGLGELPKVGALYDPDLKGESAESIYDRIATDLRRYRKLWTLAGSGSCDILKRGMDGWWERYEGMSLDDLYRRCMGQGLAYHECDGRGFLPAGLVEEIRALSQPPIPWDVELAEWFDDHFAPLEKLRTYARPSRRQSSTPDIPRPRYFPAFGAEDGRTFGVVLDTSGSMDRASLGKALGAIASYSISRDVPMVRVVFCDAATYDQGYMSPEDIAGHVKIKGRGGTVLQPGINLLEKAEDFPKTGPILVITDGFCDRLRIKRDHGILLPEGHMLPFVPRGKVFRIR
jgi:predicted metal-dependent peptidase